MPISVSGGKKQRNRISFWSKQCFPKKKIILSCLCWIAIVLVFVRASLWLANGYTGGYLARYEMRKAHVLHIANVYIYLAFHSVKCSQQPFIVRFSCYVHEHITGWRHDYRCVRNSMVTHFGSRIRFLLLLFSSGFTWPRVTYIL